MKINRFITFLVWLHSFVFLSFAHSSIANAQPSSEAGVRATVGDYIKGWREADVELLSRAFALEEGRVMWIAEHDGKQSLQSMTFREILERCRPQPEYGLDWEILALDVIDDELAMAKVSISRKGGSYIDLLVLQQIEEAWRIVSKTFVVRSD